MGFWDWAAQGDGVNGVCLVVVAAVVIVAVTLINKVWR